MKTIYLTESQVRNIVESRKKVVKNDEGEVVPEFCPKCGSKVGVYIQGEPIYKCTNKKCGEYFGTMPFPKNLKEENEKYIENKYDEKWKKLPASSDIFKKCENIVRSASGDKSSLGLMDVAEVEGDKHYIAIIHGGLNGSGKWIDYIKDIAKILQRIHGSYIIDLDVDVLDDVWTLQLGFHKEQLSEGAWGVKPEQSDSYLDWSHELGEPIIKILSNKLPKYVNNPKDNDGNIYYWLGLMLDMLKVRAFDESWLYRNSDEGRKDNKYKTIRELFKCAHKGFDYLLTDSAKENRQGWKDFGEYEKYMKKMYNEFKKLEDYYNMDKDDPKGADELIRETKLDDLTLLKGKVNSGLMSIGEEAEHENDNFDYDKYFNQIANFMEDNGLKVMPMPEVELDNSPQDGLFIKTGHYEPGNKKIVLFISDRHPKDILRSFAHEMVHHAQNLRGEDLGFGENDDVKDNKRLEKLEAEAYLKGNIMFRKWTEFARKKKGLNESVDKATEKKIRATVREMIKSGELPKSYNGEPLEMAEHYVHILRKAFDGKYKYKPEEDDSIYCSIIDDEFKKNGGHYDMDDCENHLKSIEKSLSKIVNEEIEEKINPNDISLKSFRIKKHLNPKFWIDGHLDSRVRMKLLDIADAFIDFIGIDWVKPKDIVMTGSLANYNWSSKYSDIDLHILMNYSDIDENPVLVDNYLYSQKELWNKEHDGINIYGFPVECFVENAESDESVESGVYSLEKDEWIEKPDRDNLASHDVDKKSIRKLVAHYINEIDELEFLYGELEDDEYKERKLYKKACGLWKEISTLRKKGFKEDQNEMNTGNLVFKALRRRDYIGKITKIKANLYNKLKSLNENNN